VRLKKPTWQVVDGVTQYLFHTTDPMLDGPFSITPSIFKFLLSLTFYIIYYLKY
jgi:hypothetical protein